MRERGVTSGDSVTVTTYQCGSQGFQKPVGATANCEKGRHVTGVGLVLVLCAVYIQVLSPFMGLVMVPSIDPTLPEDL